jgi:uncharacterized repeat protein (TIGR03803 family)
LAGLVIDGHGTLFGTTSAGGSHNFGTLFALAPPAAGHTTWIETVLHRFRGGGDGSQPQAGVIMDPDGILYGTTINGGNTVKNLGFGTVFAFTSGEPRPLTLLYRFLDGFAAASPDVAVIRDADGVLYGTTQGGGGSGMGTVFSLTPPKPHKRLWTEQVLYRFAGAPKKDGANPAAGLLMDGANLYGTTLIGGSSACKGSGCGTVFKLSPTAGGGWTETVLYALKGGSDGAFPMAGLIIDAAGAFYGTTVQGGNSLCSGAGCGTVFKLSPTAGGGWTETVLHRFTGGRDGIGPVGDLVGDANGNLYGTTHAGGAGCSDGCGTVFELSPAAGGGWTETVLYAFKGGRDGAKPFAGLVAGAGVFYGTTQAGGAGCGGGGCGTVFKVVP